MFYIYHHLGPGDPLKRKIDICFKDKRPKFVQAVNRMIDKSIKQGTSLVEDSVKLYEGHKE